MNSFMFCPVVHTWAILRTTKLTTDSGTVYPTYIGVRRVMYCLLPIVFSRQLQLVHEVLYILYVHNQQVTVAGEEYCTLYQKLQSAPFKAIWNVYFSDQLVLKGNNFEDFLILCSYAENKYAQYRIEPGPPLSFLYNVPHTVQYVFNQILHKNKVTLLGLPLGNHFSLVRRKKNNLLFLFFSMYRQLQ
jgi:hypothetical protein